MGVREDIKSLLAKENVTMKDIAKNYGVSPQNLSNKLRNGTIKFEEVRDIAKILGYEIEFKKKH